MAKKILIIDDEPNIVKTMESRLKANGYDVLSASDGQQGYGLVQKEKPDLVILDIMLPKIDGYKICGLLKKDRRYAGIPIIMFTARAQEEDRQLGKELGADAYIVKPFKAESLLAKMKELLGE